MQNLELQIPEVEMGNQFLWSLLDFVPLVIIKFLSLYIRLVLQIALLSTVYYELYLNQNFIISSAK